MSRKILTLGALALAGVLVIGVVVALVLPQEADAAYGDRREVSRGSSVANPIRSNLSMDAIPEGELSALEVNALTIALDDEYRAWAVYDQVIADLGNVRPFTAIRRAEESHIAALVTLFDRYGLDVPGNEWLGHVPSFDTLAEACETGVQAEIDNATLYDRLFSMVDNPDIVQVFTRLQQASQTKHLPAFERCAP